MAFLLKIIILFSVMKNPRCSAFCGRRRCRLPSLDCLNVCISHAPDCSICLVKNGSGDESVRLACGHMFHGGCIYKWFDRDLRCPMCRSYNKPGQVRVFYGEGAPTIQHSALRPVLIHLVEEEVLTTNRVGVLENGQLIQSNGDVIGFLW
jgi:hypothetical protein